MKSIQNKFASLNHGEVILISDSTVMELYAGKIPRFDRVVTLPPGEGSKIVATVERCWGQLANWGCGRDTLIVALGGGVVTDVAGFVASGYMRGIEWIAVPTTLLGMVDAAIGGKTGVNLSEGKNLVGAFWPPKETWLESAFLATLDRRQFAAGLAEVVKYGVIDGPELLEQIESEVSSSFIPEQLIKRCVLIKEKIVALDPRDSNGARAQLNFGHTFGHAIEWASGYQRYLHGEAVAIGMLMALRLGIRMGRSSWLLHDRIESLLQKIGLPTQTNLPSEQILKGMRRDKKNQSGQITCVIADEPGKVSAKHFVSEEIVIRAMDVEKVTV